jgi:cellulose synthase/poly-beta-1,6-N-acetylglucosamine synthase-like glycosyltransferase
MLAGSYANTFAIVMPGLAASDSVVPLGGTSNHLRVETLDMVGWWDPYNVTEDMDLGVKLRRAGCRVMVLPSITWEEATTGFWQQIRQSSRWSKGHVATAIAHLRHPWALFRDLGFRGSISFFTVIGAAQPATLATPLFWVLTAWYILTRSDGARELIRDITPTHAYYAGMLCLAANFFFLWQSMVACMKTDQYRLVPWMPLLPFYWITVLSAAAGKAFWEIVRGRLCYWDKTEHGLTPEPRRERWRSVSLGSRTIRETTDHDRASLPTRRTA